MTSEEQRIALAEAYGFLHIEIVPGYKCRPTIVEGFSTLIERYASVPDYLNDLDAIHELEKRLIVENGLEMEYRETLGEVCGQYQIIWFATAAQRSEAILKTIKIWK